MIAIDRISGLFRALLPFIFSISGEVELDRGPTADFLKMVSTEGLLLSNRYFLNNGKPSTQTPTLTQLRK